MDSSMWKIAIKSTGPVAVIAILLWALINSFFASEVLAIFGSNRAFILALVLISGLLAILFAAVLMHRYEGSVKRKTPPPTQVLNVSNSSVKGDVILGNKKETHKG